MATGSPCPCFRTILSFLCPTSNQLFSDNSIFFLILDNINHFANSAAHIHDVHFYFRCPNALSENMQNRFKIMKFQLPPDTTANTKVYTATESDLMDYFPVGISTYVKSDTDSFWINNAEHVQQVLLRADGIYITLKSTYLVNQWARLLLCRYPT